MPFFEDIDGNTILERNSSRLEGVEMNEARKLLKQYRRAREEIKTRLLSTGSNTFTEAKLNSSLIQIEDGIRILKSQTRPLIQQAFDFLTEQGVEDGTKEINAFEKRFNGVSKPLPIDAIIESTDPSTFLFNQFDSSIDTYNQSLRNKFQNILTQSLIQSKTWSQAVFDMEQVFNADEWILARIVRTELHGIYGQSKNNGYVTIKDEYLPDLKKTIYTPMDARTDDDSVKFAEMKQIRDLDEPFEYTWKGKKRVFMTPPDRPNDRSILIPYRSEWDK